MAITITTTATKRAITEATNTAKLLAANTSQLQNQSSAADTATASSGKSNPPQGFGEPSSKVPEVSKPGYTPATAESQQAALNKAMGVVSKTDAMKQLAGVGTSSTAAQSAKDKLTDLNGSSTTNQPSFDQGFGSQPNVDANTVPGGNPMAAFQGQSVGGVLGAAASSQPAPTPGSGAVGSGMVSQHRNGKEYLLPDDAVKRSSDGRDVTVEVEGAKDVYVNGAFVGHIDRNGDVSYDGPKNPPPPSVSIPDPDSRGGQVSVLSGAILDQLRAAQTGKPTSQGGSGDATPVDDGGIPQVVNNGSIAVNQGSINGRNLFGQPGNPIGENVSGGNKGLGGFTNSNGAGAINPGPDGGNPSGDSRFQQDPAAALGGNQPAPEFPSAVGSQESQTSSVTTTLAAGARNLTLTGTALINGTGNVLSNLINGNSAANELRGEAGNDSLDGKAGNDLLDGGAGRDLLTGGSGADRFRFATAGGFGTAQADRIIDFSRSEGDRIELSRSAFGLSAGAAVSFQAVNSDADLSRALSSSTLLVQDLRDGSLLFNQNGTAAGAGQGGVFAVVSQGLTLQVGDFALGA